MRKSFMVPNNILQKPHTSKIQSTAASLRPNQSMANVHNNHNQLVSSNQRPSRNYHDVSRLSLHSQSAHRVNGAPIFGNNSGGNDPGEFWLQGEEVQQI